MSGGGGVGGPCPRRTWVGVRGGGGGWRSCLGVRGTGCGRWTVSRYVWVWEGVVSTVCLGVDRAYGVSGCAWVYDGGRVHGVFGASRNQDPEDSGGVG